MAILALFCSVQDIGRLSRGARMFTLPQAVSIEVSWGFIPFIFPVFVPLHGL